ncbi:phage protein gp27 [Polymorphum gilvum]|uniref:Phage protein gp27 n=1 Tax=Polymorphum gilvum (strain LMG 25793 / CGMCC 1.9160 / SL003B-26A1) TaxID=991905 RepID=F2J636_POLGS|nr:phage protein gp27 [Polymorphum gilvum]ADZ72400.1 Phage protein gp27 [Polymorphum gilvum SL003B-26A1]
MSHIDPAGSLLPSNATALECGIDLAGADLAARIAPGVDAIPGWKLVNPQPALAAWLVYEYGLGALSAFIPNVFDLLEEGIRWERLRGTHAGMAAGLGFVGYSADLVDPPARRLAWADYRLTLDRVRDEEGDLARIAGIARLSQPARSQFRRGVHGYDVAAAEASWTRLSDCMVGDDSGVHVEATDGLAGPKWSFGRAHEAEVTLSQAELEALGIWIDDDGSGSLSWSDLPVAWSTVTNTWSELGSAGARVRQMAAALAARGAYLGFYDTGGALIGARRCRCFAQVAPAGAAGLYGVLGHGWSPGATGEALAAIALTGFGDGDGARAVEAALLVAATPLDPATPGKIWLGPGEIHTPHAPVGRTSVDIRFGKTVRERIGLLVRFT